MSSVCNSRNKGTFHLTKTVDYGIVILSQLGKSQNTPVSLQKISRITGLSFLFLQKIAGVLRRHGIIKAVKGNLGGYVLNTDLNKISLKQIIEILEGPIAIM